MPSIMKSPCAKLITRMTPKIRLKPTHINPYTAPVSRPAVSACRKLSTNCATKPSSCAAGSAPARWARAAQQRAQAPDVLAQLEAIDETFDLSRARGPEHARRGAPKARAHLGGGGVHHVVQADAMRCARDLPHFDLGALLAGVGAGHV